MTNLSVIIPSRSPEFLQKTIDDILIKARGDIEVIVVFDGIWSQLKEDVRVKVIHHGSMHDSPGMRESINKGIAVSTGKFIMKVDEHCMFDEGFDLKLSADCKEDWVVIPRRYRLDPDKWEIIEDGRPPIDYMLIDYPYQRPYDETCGLHGNEWRQRHYERADKMIDDTPSMQGSCYFMTRAHWDKLIQRMDSEKYGPFTQEAQEIGMKTWLSGGRVVVNKNTWYAHFHKGRRGKGYGFSNQQYEVFMEAKEKGRTYCIDYWLHTKDWAHDFDWFVRKFWPLPGWPENWREQIKIDETKDFRNSPNYRTWKSK